MQWSKKGTNKAIKHVYKTKPTQTKLSNTYTKLNLHKQTPRVNKLWAAVRVKYFPVRGLIMYVVEICIINYKSCITFPGEGNPCSDHVFLRKQ